MTDEQIKQNAEAYADKKAETVANFQRKPVVEDFIAGAHSRDEEIKELQKHIDTRDCRISTIIRLKAELEQLRDPWISVNDRLPEVGDFVFVHTNLNLIFGATRNYRDEMIGVGFVVPIGYFDYWMPIPKLPKGE